MKRFSHHNAPLDILMSRAFVGSITTEQPQKNGNPRTSTQLAFYTWNNNHNHHSLLRLGNSTRRRLIWTISRRQQSICKLRQRRKSTPQHLLLGLVVVLVLHRFEPLFPRLSHHGPQARKRCQVSNSSIRLLHCRLCVFQSSLQYPRFCS